MSGFFNDTNHGRIAKMTEMLEGPLTKSARSNKATAEDWLKLLEPVSSFIDQLRGQGPETKGEAVAEAPLVELSAGQRAAMHLANKASLKELTAALLGRLEAVHGEGKE